MGGGDGPFSGGGGALRCIKYRKKQIMHTPESRFRVTVTLTSYN